MRTATAGLVIALVGYFVVGDGTPQGIAVSVIGMLMVGYALKRNIIDSPKRRRK